MAELNAMRHTMIHEPSKYADKRVALIGVGTIGSHLANILARMQIAITMYDEDIIEEHNLATQSYGQDDLEEYKVEAVLEQIRSIDTAHKAQVVREMYFGDEIDADIIVSAVDSLDARRSIAQGMIDNEFSRPIVDGRVGREQVEVYYFATPEEWLAQLPAEADTDPCGARFTAYTAYVAAGLMANNIKRLLMRQTPPSRIIYDAATSIFIKE